MTDAWLPLAAAGQHALSAKGSNGLVLSLGCFTARLKTDRLGWRHLHPFLAGLYPDMQVIDDPDYVSEHSLYVGAPNWHRSIFRPQIVGSPGFDIPMVPLPAELTPLAFEMAWNTSVALGCYRFLILHAAVVAYEGHAIVISAQSGGGKSTFAASLVEAGGALLSDEFALIDLDSGLCHPFPRAISLKNESIELFPDVGARFYDTPKGTLGYLRPKLIATEPHAPTHLIFPTYSEGALPTAEPLGPDDCWVRLLQGSPNYHLLGKAGFDGLLRLVSSAQGYALHYPDTAASHLLLHGILDGSL